MRAASIALAALCSAGCASSTTERLGLSPPPTVGTLDVARYMGKWYEIASIPQDYQEGCTATEAHYALRPDGEIDVHNMCTKEGELEEADGRARVVDPKEPGKLEVSFFRPFWGDYWVLALGPDYRWAVVGSPSRDAVWILSRSPTMQPMLYEELLERLRIIGFEVGRIQKTPR